MRVWAVAVHGGAGAWRSEDAGAACLGVAAAVQRARILLEGGGSALDAAVAAVAYLEDDTSFNAGTGAVLNRDGEAELDAAVMTGHDLACGGVAALRAVRNPILVAQRVMTATPHVLLAGAGAQRFARAQGFPEYDPITARARAAWALRGQVVEDACEKNPAGPHASEAGGTVGAVALDGSGRLAAATSTGGVLMKLPGRVGDTPIPGAGTYANASAACSATGRGELMMRILAAKELCDRVSRGQPPQGAVDSLLREMRAGIGADAGFILLSASGELGIAHGTPAMPHAWQRAGQDAQARFSVS